MASITTRSGKGSPLTNAEVDANFTNLNTDKAELSGADFTGDVDVTGNITVSGTVDGRDLATDGTKLDGIESAADVTDTTNVVAALTAGTNVTIAADGTISASFTDTQLTTEQVQDIVGGMMTGNTETGITVTYQDADGTIDFVVATQSDENFTSALKTKLDAIEAGAEVNPTDAEIRASVEAATDSNVFTDADHSKLNGIEASADVTDTTNVVAALTAGTNVTIAADGTISATDTNTQLSNEQVQDIVGGMVTGNSESGITVTYQDDDGTLDFSVASQTDNNFTTALKNKLDGIEAGATGDQSNAEIRAAVEAASDSNVFTDADHSKLNGIEASADVTDTTNVVAALTAGTNISIAADGTISSTDTNTQLSNEQVQDIVGAMVTGNTESGITVTYQDGDGTLDFSVASQTDNNFTTTLKNKLDGIETSADVTDTTNVVAALTAGSNVSIAADGTISATDTNTQLSNEQVQDIVGAMFSGNTETRITATYQDGDGTIDLVVDDMNQTVNNATVTISAGTDLTGGGSFTTNQSGGSTITINHEDVSSAGSVNNSAGSVIQDVTLNANGHVTALASVDLDTRYAELAGATFTGDVTVGSSSTETNLLLYKADNNVADHLQFYMGSTRMGEIGSNDTTWLRINQETNKNIYTPRYIRADNGFRVDGTSLGIQGDGTYRAPNGSVSAPGISFANDTHCGLYRITTSTIGLSAGGSQKQRWHSSGTNVTGDMTASGNVTAYSDQRLKSDIKTASSEAVYQMRGTAFIKDGRAGAGVIAQELERITPHLVHEQDDGYKSVDYMGITAYLIEAVKSQKEVIDQLTKRIEALENGDH